MLERRYKPLYFNALEKDLDLMRQQIERAFYDNKAGGWLFPMELTETPDEYKLRAMLPGVDPSKINVEANEQKVTIEMSMAPPELRDEELVHLREFAYGQFSRSVELGVPIDNNAIRAAYRHGILTLEIPKQEKVRQKSIKIDVQPE